MTGPVTINIVCSHYPPHLGGVERFAYLQALEFVKRGFNVNVITDDTEKIGFQTQEQGVTVYRLPCFSPLKNNRLPIPSSLFKLWSLFRSCFWGKRHVTLVHTRYFATSLIGVLFSRFTFRQPVLIDHSSAFIDFGPGSWRPVCRCYEWLMTFLVRQSRPRVYGVAQDCNNWLKQLGFKPAGVYYNGIDPQRFQPTPEDVRSRFGLDSQKIVLAVGRLIREKGVMELLAGFARFQENFSNWRLVVIGRGELESELREAAKKYSWLSFIGPQGPEVVAAFMQQSSILVNPSNYPEGLPTVLLEAGLSGLAVIATPQGGSKEVILHGDTGLLIQRGESALIAEALARLAADPDLCKTLGHKLQQHVAARFTVAAITNKFIKECVEREGYEEA